MAVLNFYHIGKTIPEGAVYIGRANAAHKLAGSVFANPFPVDTSGTGGHTREESIALFRDHLWELLRSGRVTEQQLLALEGRDLVCYCAPKACHGHVLEKAVAWAVRRRDQALTGAPVAPCPVSAPRRPAS